MVPGGEDPPGLCDPLTFVPVEERHLLWSVLEKDGLLEEIPGTFRDVRIAGNKSFGKGTNLFFRAPTVNTLKGWRDCGGLHAFPILGLDETLRGQLGSSAGTMLREQLCKRREREEQR